MVRLQIESWSDSSETSQSARAVHGAVNRMKTVNKMNRINMK